MAVYHNHPLKLGNLNAVQCDNYLNTLILIAPESGLSLFKSKHTPSLSLNLPSYDKLFEIHDRFRRLQFDTLI